MNIDEAIKHEAILHKEKVADSYHRQLADWLKDYKRLKEQQPCKDTISRTEVMKVLSDFVTLEKYIDKHNHITFEPLEQMINSLPSVNPQEPKIDTWSIQDVADNFKKHGLIREQKPKTGHWEWVQYDYNPKLGNWHCSECRCVVVECVGKEEKGGIPLYKYCPQCGAKMEVSE